MQLESQGNGTNGPELISTLMSLFYRIMLDFSFALACLLYLVWGKKKKRRRE
jgi:hypothetical protein